jgi:hypothetical protein
MKRFSPKRAAKRGQEGYVLVMLMFFLALLVLSMAAAAPTVMNEIRRDREEEMVWRGKQYVRGIRLFYQKVHRFPVELDDLTKPKTGLRFMRQAYKDPMNQVDGSWRLIFLGPGGVLIGSLKLRCVNFGGQPVASLGGAAPLEASPSFGGSPNSGAQSSSSFGGSSFSTSSNSSGSNFGTPVGTTPAGCRQTSDSSGNSSGSTQGSNDQTGLAHDIASTDEPKTIVGGNIIGVGSKVNKESLRSYEKATNYRLFEFVWDPTVDTITGRQTGLGTFPGQVPGSVTPGTVNPLQPSAPGQTQNPSNPNAPQDPPLQAPPNP